jgi:hypothetical protein
METQSRMTQELLPDLDLARMLGFQRPRRIRGLIQRHAPSLGELRPTAGQNQHRRRGRPSKGYLLTPAQALYIAAKSNTPQADAVLLGMIRASLLLIRAPVTRPTLRLGAHGGPELVLPDDGPDPTTLTSREIERLLKQAGGLGSLPGLADHVIAHARRR